MMTVEILTAPGRFETGEIPRPTIAADEVLVEVAAVAICGSDLSAFRGTHPAITPPTVLGHEFSGTVVALGRDVSGLKPGDRVCIDPTFGCGRCRLCLRGRANICPHYTVMGRHLGFPGGLAGLVGVRSDHVYRLPDVVDLASAALVQPLAVGFHAAAHRAGVSDGDVVLIAGAGAIGLAVLMTAKEYGASVIVSDPVPARRLLAEELGADTLVDPVADDLAAVVAEMTGGYGVDVAFEAVGGTDDALIRLLIGLTARGGTTVVLGLKTDLARVPMKDIKYAEKTVTGSSAHPDSFPAVIERIADGRFPASRLITHRLPFSRVAEALALLDSRSGGAMKIVLEPD